MSKINLRGLRKYTVMIILGVLMVLFSFSSPYFLTLRNLTNIVNQNTYFIIAAIGLSFVMIGGGIDLSVGYQMSLVGVVTGMCMVVYDIPAWLSVTIGLLLGSFLGFFNGMIVANIRVFPLIVTIATSTVFQGISYMISKAQTFRGFPPEFLALTHAKFLGSTLDVWLTLLIVLFANFVYNRMSFGWNVLALGGNEEAWRRTRSSCRRETRRRACRGRSREWVRLRVGPFSIGAVKTSPRATKSARSPFGESEKPSIRFSAATREGREARPGGRPRGERPVDRGPSWPDRHGRPRRVGGVVHLLHVDLRPARSAGDDRPALLPHHEALPARVEPADLALREVRHAEEALLRPRVGRRHLLEHPAQLLPRQPSPPHHHAQRRGPVSPPNERSARKLEKRAAALARKGQALEAAELCRDSGLPDAAVRYYLEAGEPARAAELRRAQIRFAEAAELYIQAGQFDAAGTLYASQNDYERAADCYRKGGRMSVAAETYKKAHRYLLAGECYMRCEFHRQAAQAFVKVQDWAKAAQALELAIAEEVNKPVAGQDRKRENELKKLVLQAGKLHEEAGDIEAATRVLEQGECWSAAGEVAMRHGRHRKAAECFERAGNVPKAAEALRAAGESAAAAQILGEHLRDKGNDDEAARLLVEAGDCRRPPAPP